MWRASGGSDDHLESSWINVGARGFGVNIKMRGAGVCNCCVRFDNAWRQGRNRWSVWQWGGSIAGTRR